ncbi:HlyD family efflux transporter periplasmic adaptor subunit [Thiolapillus sp.]|uniref:HlyD family efflux transporter periplasmic adaptor subunit n=1 Tax=Thiolapillus sp. TaxID=2017437 RepID=UPI003AF5EA6E
MLTLADPASLVVQVPASEQMLADLGTDSRVLMYPDIPGAAPIAGRLQRIFPTLDPQSRQGTLEIALPDSPGGMRAGQFVRVQVAGALKKRLLIRKRPRIHTCFPDLTPCRLSPEISRHRRNRWTCLMPPKARHSGSHTLRPGNNLA